MAEELVRLTSQNDEIEEKVKEIPKLKVLLKVSCICQIDRVNIMYFIIHVFSCTADMCVSVYIFIYYTWVWMCAANVFLNIPTEE